MLTDRELDQLIDAALPSYSSAEPQPGLEQRILSHALAETRPKRSLTWAWAIAVPAVACLLVFLFLPGHRYSHRSSLEATTTTAPAPPVVSRREKPRTNSSPAPQKRLVPHRASTQPLASHEALPKEEVFPSPSLLTAEERSLIAYNAAQLRATSTGAGTQLDINSLTISELQIQPLDIPALDLPASKASEFSRNEQQP